MSVSRARLLVCGAIRGAWDAVISKVSAAHAKAGPFICVLVVGRVDVTSPEARASLAPYRMGERRMDVPFYVLDGCTPADDDELRASRIAPQITWLGACVRGS